MAAKRQRTTNFSEEEKTKLLDLIRDSVELIENKSYDKVTLIKKNEVWKNILNEFCAQGYSRSVNQLQTLWRDLKKKAKILHAAEKRSIYATGGGTSESHIDTISKIVIDILPQSILTPILGVDDDDSDIHESFVSDLGDTSFLAKKPCITTVASPNPKPTTSYVYDPKVAAKEEHELKIKLLSQRLLFDEEEHEKRMSIYNAIERKLQLENSETTASFSYLKDLSNIY